MNLITVKLIILIIQLLGQASSIEVAGPGETAHVTDVCLSQYLVKIRTLQHHVWHPSGYIHLV